MDSKQWKERLSTGLSNMGNWKPAYCVLPVSSLERACWVSGSSIICMKNRELAAPLFSPFHPNFYVQKRGGGMALDHAELKTGVIYLFFCRLKILFGFHCFPQNCCRSERIRATQMMETFNVKVPWNQYSLNGVMILNSALPITSLFTQSWGQIIQTPESGYIIHNMPSNKFCKAIQMMPPLTLSYLHTILIFALIQLLFACN